MRQKTDYVYEEREALHLGLTRRVGEGQGECKRCKELKGWNSIWTSFLYKIEGRDGAYCFDCVKAIVGEEMRRHETENSLCM